MVSNTQSVQTEDVLRLLSDILQRQPQDNDIISGIDAIAEELSISYHHARNGLMTGQIPARRLGEKWLASRSALRRWASGELVAVTPVQRQPGRPRKQPKQSTSA